MHKKQYSDLLPADTELERTLRSLRKTKRAENATMADERHDETEEQRTAARRPPMTDTMEDFHHLGRIFCSQTAYCGCKQLQTEASLDNNGATASVHWPPH